MFNQKTGATQKVREMLHRNPHIPNKEIMRVVRCSNAIVSRTRRDMGLRLQPRKSYAARVFLPEYLYSWLQEEARNTGPDVTVQDMVMAILNDAKDADA